MKKVLFCVVSVGLLLCLCIGTAFTVFLRDLGIAAVDGTFLGTLNDNADNSNSVYNEYGKGSKYDSKAIMNKYGDYGSDYSDKSPFNPYASNAPFLRDRQENNYGRLSVNKPACVIA